MYRISELAKRCGLARSTLLYYEKQGLLEGRRRENGYRYYDDNDLQQLLLLQELHEAGLSLKECQQMLTQGVDRTLLHQRLTALEQEITRKRNACQLLKGLLGQSTEGIRAFHQRAEQLAPMAHSRWLEVEGFDEAESLRLKWLSKDVATHQQYMNDFERIFIGLERHGPGTDADSLWALNQVGIAPQSILDIGCGPGASALLLAKQTQAQVIGVDTFESSIASFRKRIETEGLQAQVSVVNASMTKLPFDAGSFDLIWCENSAYIMGFEQALQQWQSLLKPQGYLVISDLVWLKSRDEVEPDIRDFWQQGYPDMQSKSARLAQCHQHGYELIGHRLLGKAAWQAFTQPVAQRVEALAVELDGSQALVDQRHELTVLDRFDGQFTYMIMVLKKAPKQGKI
ncbi:MerR family transcriptional regulator [Ferrimonas aestuarii]|uniref:Methyltransferase domain-containing protein n=1 Tax=Ferrimonas aestuarii TaxID=2569539 RepID=A0A4U1BGL4_9GAMM|nr:MerR family transcriptional regulator [Ferrimonas aestuarii]TKB50122.1 methyltransferase domain-containing protein [Ferrimonas aestuarii]